MPWYRFDGTREGERPSAHIGARDAQAAKSVLTERGFEDVVVHAALTDLHPDAPPTPAPKSKKSGVIDAVLWLGVTAWLVVSFTFAFSGWLTWGVVALVGVGHVVRAVFRPGNGSPYDRLLEAYVWRRHGDVLKLANELAKPDGHTVKTMMLDVDFRAAAVLWAHGRDDDAEALVERHIDEGDAKRMRIWWGRRAGSLHYARRDDEAIEAARRCLAVDPSNVTSQLDLAAALVQLLRSTDEPRQLLERAVTGGANPLVGAYRRYVRGMVEVEEHRYPEAASSLKSARWRLRCLPLGHPGSSLRATLDGYLCLALAASDPVEAEASLERARELLEVAGNHELVGRCERALARRGHPYR